MSVVAILAVKCDRCGEVEQTEPTEGAPDKVRRHVPMTDFLNHRPHGWGTCALQGSFNTPALRAVDLCPQCFEHAQNAVRVSLKGR